MNRNPKHTEDIEPSSSFEELTISHREIAESLSALETSQDILEEVDKALVLLSRERPELRYELYKKVRHGSKPEIGAMFSVQEAARRVCELPRRKAHFIKTCEILRDLGNGSPESVQFNPRHLFEAGLPNYNSDVARTEFIHLGLIEKTDSMYGKRHFLQLTAKGVAVMNLLVADHEDNE